MRKPRERRVPLRIRAAGNLQRIPEIRTGMEAERVIF